MLRNRLKNLNQIFRIGLLLFAVATAVLMSNQARSGPHSNLFDGIMGLLFGASFGCMLVGLRLLSSAASQACDRTNNRR